MVGAVVLDDVARARPSPRAAPSSWRLVFQSRPAPRVAASTSSGSNSRCTIAAAASRPQPEVDRADQRLERVGEDRVLVAAAGGLLAAAEQQVRADAAVAEPAGDAGQRGHVDHGGTQLGQLALGEVGLAAVELVGDDQAEHRVAQELQALVGGQAAVLVRERPVGQRQAEQAVGQGDAEGVVQPGGRPLGVRRPTRRAVARRLGARHDACSERSGQTERT